MGDMEEKPLHVQVAEALGWKRTHACPLDMPKCFGAGIDGCVKDYDTDWSATGPLIEKYSIGIVPSSPMTWAAWTYVGKEIVTYSGATHLIAVCKLILRLGALGALTR